MTKYLLILRARLKIPLPRGENILIPFSEKSEIFFLLDACSMYVDIVLVPTVKKASLGERVRWR